MSATHIAKFTAAVIAVVTLSSAAHAQCFQTGNMVNCTGSGQTGGYGQPTSQGSTFYLPPQQQYQPQQTQAFNPSQPVTQQYQFRPSQFGR